MAGRPVVGFSELEQQVWKNLVESELLSRICAASKHASNPSEYTHISFWSELSTSIRDYRSGMWLQINIEKGKQEQNGDGPRIFSQPVTPKLYRLSEDEEELPRLAEQIWKGVTTSDIHRLALAQAEMFYGDDQKGWLETTSSHIIRRLYPALQQGRADIELLPRYAQYRILYRG